MRHVFRRQVLRGAGVLALAMFAASLLLVASGPWSQYGGLPVPDLTVQFGVSAATASQIVGALNSWWAVALSLALVPLGMGGATLMIRATWKTLTTRLGEKAAREKMVTF